MEATVDGQVHSVDKEGVLTCEKCNYTRDFLWCSGPTDGEAFTKSRHYRFTLLNIGSGLGEGETRCHGARLAWIVAPESLALKRDRETLAAVTVVFGRVFRGPEFEAPDFYL
jgi:hypothetical protein